MMPNKFKLGDTIDSLTVVSLRKEIMPYGKTVMFWTVRCNCGTVCEMRTTKIRMMADAGNASCGCQKKLRPKVGRRSCRVRAHEKLERLDARDPTPEQIAAECRLIRIEKGEWFE